jgi:hypothetical protein
LSLAARLAIRAAIFACAARTRSMASDCCLMSSSVGSAVGAAVASGFASGATCSGVPPTGKPVSPIAFCTLSTTANSTTASRIASGLPTMLIETTVPQLLDINDFSVASSKPGATPLMCTALLCSTSFPIVAAAGSPPGSWPSTPICAACKAVVGCGCGPCPSIPWVAAAAAASGCELAAPSPSSEPLLDARATFMGISCSAMSDICIAMSAAPWLS